MPVQEQSDEDCGETSGDEDAVERLNESAPTKRPVEEEWVECSIAVD